MSMANDFSNALQQCLEIVPKKNINTKYKFLIETSISDWKIKIQNINYIRYPISLLSKHKPLTQKCSSSR